MNSAIATPATATATTTTMKKRLVKKTATTEETPVETVSAPAPAPTPEPATTDATTVPKKRGPKKATETPAPTPVSETIATPAPAPAAELPTSTEVATATAVVAKPTVVEDIHTNLARLIKIRDEASASIACLKALIVKHNREVKDARKRKNKKKTTETSEGVAEGATEAAERRPNVFTTPRKLSEGLCTFLGVPAMSEIPPTEVTTRLHTYIDENHLTGTKKSEIIPDEALAKLMNVPVGTTLHWPEMQRILYHDHYGFGKKTQ